MRSILQILVLMALVAHQVYADEHSVEIGRSPRVVAGPNRFETLDRKKYNLADLKDELSKIVVITFDERTDKILETDPHKDETYEKAFQKLATTLDKYAPKAVFYDFSLPESKTIESYFPSSKTKTPFVVTPGSFAEIEKNAAGLRESHNIVAAHCYFLPNKQMVLRDGKKTEFTREAIIRCEDEVVRSGDYLINRKLFAASFELFRNGGNKLPENVPDLAVRIKGPTEKVFKTISLEDLLDGKVPTTEIDGKFVFVGSNHKEFDVCRTQSDECFNGVFFHALSLAALLKGDGGR